MILNYRNASRGPVEVDQNEDVQCELNEELDKLLL